MLKVDPAVEAELVRRGRRPGDATATPAPSRPPSTIARSRARRVAEHHVPTIALAHAGGTTGEWADVLREVFGEYRAPTGVSGAYRAAPRGGPRRPCGRGPAR